MPRRKDAVLKRRMVIEYELPLDVDPEYMERNILERFDDLLGHCDQTIIEHKHMGDIAFEYLCKAHDIAPKEVLRTMLETRIHD